MNIVFFGTGSFGLPTLEALGHAQKGHRVVAVVTLADKPKGRHLKVGPSAIKEWAQKHQVPIVQFAKDRLVTTTDTLGRMSADIFVVISFGALLPESLLRVPRIGSFNVHSSLLPLYRGAAPIRWAIMNGDAKTGVTVMKMNNRLDAGEILLQKETAIRPEDDAVTLEKRLSELGSQALLESLDLLEKKAVRFVPQEEARTTYARKIVKEDGHIDWKKNSRNVLDQIRAMAGWPNAFSFHQGKRLLVLEAKLCSSAGRGDPGLVTASSLKEGVRVCALEGSVELLRLQLESKKPLPSKEFLKGYPLKAGEFLE